MKIFSLNCNDLRFKGFQIVSSLVRTEERTNNSNLVLREFKSFHPSLYLLKDGQERIGFSFKGIPISHDKMQEMEFSFKGQRRS